MPASELSVSSSALNQTSSTSVLDAMEILGSDLSRARLRVALAHIGVSKKQAKNIERAYRDYPQA